MQQSRVDSDSIPSADDMAAVSHGRSERCAGASHGFTRSAPIHQRQDNRRIHSSALRYYKYASTEQDPLSPCSKSACGRGGADQQARCVSRQCRPDGNAREIKEAKNTRGRQIEPLFLRTMRGKQHQNVFTRRLRFELTSSN